MTEIPEHLLKRSRERRGAVGLPTTGGEEAGTSTVPAVAAAPKAAVAKPEAAPAPKVAPPEPAFIQAAKRRRRIPIWAMPVVAGLPLWGFVYVNVMRPRVVAASGPLAVGAGVFVSCASCHNPDGSGGVGYPLWNEEAIKSFPNIEDQIRFVYNGNNAYVGKTYTPADRAGGAHVGGVRGAGGAMPAWGLAAPNSNQLTDAQLLGAICEERYGLSGDATRDKYKAEWDKWCSPDAPNWTLVEDGGFKAVKLDTSPTVAIPSAAASSTATGTVTPAQG